MIKYLYIVKTQILKSLTYNYSVYGNIIMQTIIMITTAFFWKALFSSATNVGGVDVESMLTYTVLSSMLSVLMYTNVERRIELGVRDGIIATDLMKPINVFGEYLAEDIGSVIALLFQNLLPIFVIGWLVIKLPLPKDISLLPLFFISTFESVAINWLVAALFGMLAFRVLDIDALIQVKKHLIRLLSGSIIPIWFFPETLQRILRLFPFVYIYQLPISIYIARDELSEIIAQMWIQTAWLVILASIFVVAQKKAIKKLMVQGG